VGWAQYDPRTLSAKVFRHTGRWSRQSEEIPLHRAIDLTTVIVYALRASLAADGRVEIAPTTLEHQENPKTLTLACVKTDERAMFDTLIQDPLVRRRLSKLADALGELRARGEI
jgi:hypothetical protein